ncbi:TetR/AcrR family transcriptional regulator [Nonomuraea sediminis]|uniref:TetR/AcrR family transcriptional regulator n=1 Tax=Nonomuraea sediminis TaxID=2835864 RepID=UPI001BDC7D3B|nr:TetR/AcrR family transcriptional regulator [Nonomuraea sediminis]
MSRTRSRATADEVEARRAEILAATARVVARKSVEGTRLADVAEEAGVSIGLIQHYFRNRERLIVETFQSAIEQARAEWRSYVANASDPVARLRELLTFCVTGKTPFSQAWGLWLEFYAASARDPGLRLHVHSVMNIWYALFAETIAAGVQAKRLHPRDPIEICLPRILATVDGLAIQALLGLYGMSEHNMEAALIRTVAVELGIDESELRG